jgi:hypothetical protein
MEKKKNVWWKKLLWIVIGILFTIGIPYCIKVVVSASGASRKVDELRKEFVLHEHLDTLYKEKQSSQMKYIGDGIDAIKDMFRANKKDDSLYKHNVNAILKELCNTNETNAKLFNILFDQSKSKMNYYYSDTNRVKYLTN